jgi:hypothetical protein
VLNQREGFFPVGWRRLQAAHMQKQSKARLGRRATGCREALSRSRSLSLSLALIHLSTSSSHTLIPHSFHACGERLLKSTRRKTFCRGIGFR